MTTKEKIIEAIFKHRTAFDNASDLTEKKRLVDEYVSFKNALTPDELREVAAVERELLPSIVKKYEPIDELCRQAESILAARKKVAA